MFFKKINHIFLFLLLLSGSLMANQQMLESQIIDKVVNAIYAGQKVYAWGETSANQVVIKNSTKMTLSSQAEDASFILISKNIPKTLGKNAVLFTNNYDLMESNQEIIGAFFWQKGRPNLLFIRERLRKKNITLGRDFDKYIEDEL